MKSLIISAGVALASFAISAAAQSPQDTDIAKCFSIQDNSTRLDCYDNIAKRSMRSAEEVAIEKKEAEKKKFGLWGRGKVTKPENFGVVNPEPTEITEISSQIKEIEFLNKVAKRIHLENGQIWSQVKSDSRFLNKTRAARYVEENVTIKKAAVGSFKMRVGADGPTIRVRRIK